MTSVRKVSELGAFEHVAGHFRAFRRWWLGELTALLPYRLGKSGHVVVPGAAVVLGEHTIDIFRGMTSMSSPLSSIPAAPQAVGEAMAWIKANGMAGSGVVILLPLSRCLVRTVKMPGVARDDLRAVLDLELAHSTPFKPGMVVWTHVDDTPRQSGGVMSVRQVIARRDLFEGPLLDAAGQGMAVNRLYVVDEADGSIVGDNLLSMRGDSAPRLSQHGFWVVLFMALALGTLIWIVLSRQEGALQLLRGELQTARAKHQAIDAIQRQQQVRSAASAELTRLAHADVRVTEVLREVTHRLPDSAWLTDFRLVDDKLELSGFASGAAALIDALSSAPQFSEVAFSAPVTRDDREAKEHFVLSLKVRRPN